MKSRFRSTLEEAASQWAPGCSGSEELQLAYRKLRSDDIQLPNWISRIAFNGMKGLRRITNIDALAGRVPGGGVGGGAAALRGGRP